MTNIAIDYRAPFVVPSQSRRIARLVSAHFGIDIRQRCREKRYVTARHVYCFLCQQLTKPKLSLPRIGRVIGLDHTSVLHGIRRCAERMQTEKNICEAIELITVQFNDGEGQ